MARAKNDTDAVTYEDGTATIRLTGGGTLNLIDFPDGSVRLMYEHKTTSWGVELSGADVMGIRAASNLVVVGRLREVA